MKTLLLSVAISMALITSLLMFPVSAKHNDTHDANVHSYSIPKETCNTNMTHNIGDLVVSKAFVRPTTKDGMSSAGYMTLTNNGDVDDTLINIHLDSASTVEIHETKIDDNGVMSMKPITDGIVIPAKQSVDFKPRGLHFMLIDIKYPLVKGTQIPVTLNFKHSGTQKININIADKNTPESCN
jgi:periplasmic copper chaperone A